jgi:type I pantothenate kinase
MASAAVRESAAVDAVDVVVAEAELRGARLVGVTGGVAAGKSTLGAAVGARLGAPVVASDGFLLTNAQLAERSLTHRKGFPESFDAAALAAFLDRWRGTGFAEAPVYSHLAYDVDGPPVTVAGDRLIVEGLHLSHPALRVRDRFDLLVHIDAADPDLARWYLQRFQALRSAAAEDPTAFLHAFREMPGEVLDGMAMDVWASVNLVVLEEEIRPWAGEADLALWLGPDHEVVSVERR